MGCFCSQAAPKDPGAGVVGPGDKDNSKTISETYKCVLTGPSDSGKTSLLCKFCFNEFPADRDIHDDPLEVTVEWEEHGTIIKAPLLLYDTGGTEKFRTITKSYYDDAEGVIMVFDITDPQSFADVTGPFIQEVGRYAEKSRPILVGNKSDEKKGVDLTEVKRWAEKNNITFIETSAKTGENVKEVFTILAREIYEVKYL